MINISMHHYLNILPMINYVHCVLIYHHNILLYLLYMYISRLLTRDYYK